MKRKAIIKTLAEAGCTFKEGGSHTRVYDRNGVYRAAIPRHAEVNELTVKAIAKQTGVKLQ